MTKTGNDFRETEAREAVEELTAALSEMKKVRRRDTPGEKRRRIARYRAVLNKIEACQKDFMTPEKVAK